MSVLNQTSDNDLALTNGQLSIVTDPAECAAIELRNKFLFVQGEYFLDTRQGVPYFVYVFKKNPDLLVVKQLFTEVILGSENVAKILSLTVSKTPDRKGHFAFKAQAVNGKVITGGSGQPFIVQPS